MCFIPKLSITWTYKAIQEEALGVAEDFDLPIVVFGELVHLFYAAHLLELIF